MGVGRTNAGGASPVKGGAVSVAHSAGSQAMTDRGVVTLGEGRQYRLLEIRQSGTLTFDASQLTRGILADVCICNGGQGGGRQSSNHGGQGGMLINVYGVRLQNLTVVIGAGGTGKTGVSGEGALGGITSIKRSGDANAISAPLGLGSGGGNGANESMSYAISTRFYGDGYGKRPFGDPAYFGIHSGGGGGGGYYGIATNQHRKGGQGGTNGGDGSYVSTGGFYGGPAGDASAGAGGGGASAGANAAYYGGGGGGGGVDGEDSLYGNGGNGYQGVVWVRIPA